jgi:hypothetical protein
VTGGGVTPLTLRVLGQRFTSTSQVQYGLGTRSVTFVNANELQITLSAADQSAGGPFGVRVLSATESSNQAVFTIADFEFYNIGPSEIAVAPGASATYSQRLISRWKDFLNPVTFSCSGLPHGAACQFSPASIAPGSGEFVEATITTTPPATTASSPAGSGVQWFALALPVALFAVPIWRSRRIAGILAVLALAFLLLSCGGGGASTNVVPHPPPPPVATTGPTPLGTYAITMKATSGGLSHSTVVSLKVQ